MIPNDDTRDSVYDYYDMMSDDELIKEMEETVSILQMSNQEEMSVALHAFINRFRDVCVDYREVLDERAERNRNV
jgi:hypothetical protein